jgi:HEAT repeat protein
MSAKQLLDDLFDADRRLHEAEQKLLDDTDEDELRSALERAADVALALKDGVEASLRLTRLADLCAQLQGPRMAETLLRILNHESPEVRVAAGEALRDYAYDRYAEVARAIERALAKDEKGPALAEVPWILAEVGEPSALPLVGKCLSHPEAEVAASAIEALVELGDPEAVPLLKRLLKDTRTVEIDEGDESYSTTLGELAHEAIDSLSER